MQKRIKSKKSKVKSLVFALFTSVFFIPYSLPATAQQVGGQVRPGPSYSPQEADKLFSPSVAQKFYEIAYELAKNEDVNRPATDQAKQALIFLTATMDLDKTSTHALRDILEIASRDPEQDFTPLIAYALTNYLNKSADLEVIEKVIQYLLERSDSREQRERFLGGILMNMGGRNAALDSQLATRLGLLKAETSDDPNAIQFLMQAYSNNKYNKLAFSKLAELMGEQIDPAMYLEQLRLVLGENPLNLEAALAFAEYAEQLQLYQIASDAYEYCTKLFTYLYPSQPLPDWLYLPWSISSYNTQRDQYKCLQIASDIRQSGRFDLFVEAIAGKAAAKIGDIQQATRLLKDAEYKVQSLLADNSFSAGHSGVSTEQLAWFYCFVLPDAGKAIEWANKAYSVDPNSTSAGILAYSLVMNGQNGWAKSIIDNYQKTPIADLALAQIRLEEDQKTLAFETLKSVIARDPGAFEAEKAKEILTNNGGEYIPPVDPGIVLMTLGNNLNQAVVPTFISPQNLISFQLNVRGSKFSYGSKFGASVVITNNSFEPLIISDDALITGNIRVDADVSGDLNVKIPNLVSIKIKPALPIEPGQNFLVPLRLTTGRLRQILLTYPQASLDIELTAYLDPITTTQGQVVNRLADIMPAKILIKRSGKVLSAKFLQNQLNSISKGRQGQKTKIAQLFAGLLMEQHAMANREPLYKFMYADWMPDLLKSALLHSLTDDDWVVKVHTMVAMLPLPMDYEMIDAVSKSLGDTNWPIRMMAIYLLAKTQGSSFGKVLDYSAQYDSNEFVRQTAIALGGVIPEVKQPPNQPVSGMPRRQP